MGKIKVRWIIYGLLMLMALTGCGEKKLHSLTIKNNEEITEILLDNAKVCEGALVKEYMTIPIDENPNGVQGYKKDDVIENYALVKNSKSAFYISSYSEQMAQFSYRSEIYCYDFEEKIHTMIYSTKEAVWVNELKAGDRFLIWQEWIPNDTDIAFVIKSYDCETGETECIAVVETNVALCMSDKYVTWYESNRDTGGIALAIYDFDKKKLNYLAEDNIALFMPHERAFIVDDGITYFTVGKDNKVCVKRYNMATEKIFSVALEDNEKLAGCFSNSEYIGWFTEYTHGCYFLYNMKDGKTYRFNSDGNMEIFDIFLADKLYINERMSNRIYSYDMNTSEALYQELPDDNYALHFTFTDERKPDFRISSPKFETLVEFY